MNDLIKKITNSLTDDMAEYGMVARRVTDNATSIIKTILVTAGWDKPDNPMPSLESYNIVAIDQENLDFKPFKIVRVRRFLGWNTTYHLESKNGAECTLENLDPYTLVVLAQAVVREYEKTLQE
jgi:hypothetical protein